MSNETFNLSSEQHHVRSRGGPSSLRGLPLSLSSGDWNGNSVPSLAASSSPSSMSSLSDADNQSPEDVDMLECSFGEGNHSPTTSLAGITFVVPSAPNDATSPREDRELNHTFSTTAAWSETTTVVTGCLEAGEGESSCCYLEPRSETESSLDTDGASIRGSDGNDCLSEGTAMRNNTFCLEDNSLGMSVLLQSASTSPLFSHSTLLPDLHQTYATSLMDSCSGGWKETVTVVTRGKERPCEGRHTVSIDIDTAAGSPERDSGEMVMRTNSFCLEDQSLPVTFLEESAFSLALDSPTLPGEVSQLSATVPDQLQDGRPTEGVRWENEGPQQFGQTFIQSSDQDLSTKSNRIEASSSSLVALPNESEGGHRRTFLCDSDLIVAGVESPAPDAPQTCPAERSTSEANRTFVLAASEVLDPGNVQTSTPLQNSGSNNHFSFSLSESSCSEHTGSPACLPARDQRSTPRGVTVKPRPVARTPLSFNKTEIRRFPKPDFSGIRPKILTRPANQFAIGGNMSNNAPPRKQPYVSLPSRAGKSVKTVQTRNLNRTTVFTTSAEAAIADVQPEQVEGASYLGTAVILSDKNPRSAGAALPLAGSMSGPVEGEQISTQIDSLSSESKLPLTALPDTKQATDSPAQCPGNETFTFPSAAEPPTGDDQLSLKPSSSIVSRKKGGVLNRDGKKPGPGPTLDKPLFPSVRSRCMSESLSRVPREAKQPPSSTASFSTSKGQFKPEAQSRSSHSTCPKQPEPRARKGASCCPNREITKTSLVPVSPKSSVIGATGAQSEGSRGRLGARPSPSNPRRTLLSQAASTCPSPPGLSQRPASRWRPGGTEKRSGIPKDLELPLSKPSSVAGVPRAQPPAEGSVGSGSRPPCTPCCPPVTGQPSIPGSRLPLRGNPRKIISQGSEKSGSRGSPHGIKTTASANQGSSSSGAGLLRRTSSFRLSHPAKTLPVDKSRPKASQQERPPPAPPAGNGRRPDLVVAAGRAARSALDAQADCEGRDRSLQQLGGLLAASDRRFEAIGVVLQRTLSERDEALKQRGDLSQELVTLRGELVSSAHSCERLVREKEDVQAALEELLEKVKEQHQDELAQLEQRLQAFYQAEWDKVHQAYQEEADRCRALMEQQMSELRASHETVKLQLETSHSEQLQSVKKQCENSVEELRKTHEQELQTLNITLKETEASLCGRIQELTTENKVFSEKIMAEEARRKDLAEKHQTDSHTLYLEQELESLKVVLDIKNKQLHQQDKKLLQLDKLVEKNVKLEECFQKVRQENEDYRARMDRHAALSRQLSTEQAVLQESLQKESKVNKRLSMENEELMWKLHNGDMSSPRKMSPSSASNPLSLQSPRSSAVFSSPPISPR